MLKNIAFIFRQKIPLNILGDFFAVMSHKEQFSSTFHFISLTFKSCSELEQIQLGAVREQGSDSHMQNKIIEPQYPVHEAGREQNKSLI